MTLVSVSQAMAFVNSHAPISAQAYIVDGVAQKLFIASEEVDRYGYVKNVTDIIEAKDGMFSLDAIRDVLGY